MLKRREVAKAIIGLFTVSSGVGALAAEGNIAIEEIIVTAQKTAERLQDVPISVQAFNFKALENAAVSNMSDFQVLAPSVFFRPSANNGDSYNLLMRGAIALPANIFTDPAVAVHVDGVYIPRVAGLNLSMVDVDSVEILKGPQGTLYGRNATAGAININTSRPTQEFGFVQNITVGDYGKAISKTSINAPLTDALAAKIAYVHDERDGFIKDSNGSGRNYGDRKTDAGRLDFRWEPSSTVVVDYGYDWSKATYIDGGGQCFDQISSGAASTGTSAPMAAGTPIPSYLGIIGTTCSTDRLTSRPMPNGTNGLSMMPDSVNEISGHMLKVEWEVTPTLTFRSITGYRYLDDLIYAPLVTGFYESARVNLATTVNGPNYGPFGTANSIISEANGLRQDVKSLSQEFVLLGKPSPYFRYLVGAYYFDEKGTYRESPGLVRHTADNASLPFELGQNGKAHNESAALFGQFTWTPDILDRKLDITPGLRYTRDSRSALLNLNGIGSYNYNAASQAYNYAPPSAAAIANNVSASADFSRTSPALTFQYRVTEDVMAYGKVTQGYRSGGFNKGASTLALYQKGFAPETVKSTELGFKGEFLQHRLRTNLAVFQSKYDDMQTGLASSVPGKFDISNAGKATVDGIELDLSLAATENLRFGLNWTNLNFKYDKVSTTLTGGRQADVTDFLHLQPEKNAYSITMDLKLGKIGPGKVGWHLDYAHRDKTYYTVVDPYNVNTGALLQRASADNYTTPAYGIWNTRLAMSDIPVGPGNQGTLTVGLWIKNMTDKKYASAVSDMSIYFLPVGRATRWGDPLTYGFDLTYRY